MTPSIAANLQAVLQQMRTACAAAARPADSVALVAVSKAWPAPCLRAAALAGQRAFGENYVQEAQIKMAQLADLADLPLVWHFIGPLQSNKTRLVAENFSWVHSVERLKIAERLAAQRPPHLPALQVCLQVNLSGEASKSGCAPTEAAALARAVAQLPRLSLRGLMAIPEPTPDTALARQRFARLRALKEDINQQCGIPMDTLSMGMSADFAEAIAEGATLVRLGSAIFGARPAQRP